MTLARPLLAVVLALAVAAGSACAAHAEDPGLGTQERVVADPLTGIAIYGFDPVAYFAEGRPRGGSLHYEVRWGDAVWRFSTAANREAFMADPAIYAPAFGGHDAEAVSRGIATASDPSVFVVQGGRLYLFRSADARARFLGEALGPQASVAWGRLEPTLLP
jgi:hypothetical protein